MKWKKKWLKPQIQATSKFKSKLEEEFNNFLEASGIKFAYENFTISYLKPARASRYTPDFSCPDINNNYSIIFETKGHFITADRQKHLFIKQQYPLMDIRFVFSNSKNRIGKKSQTTYKRTQTQSKKHCATCIKVAVIIENKTYYCGECYLKLKGIKNVKKRN